MEWFEILFVLLFLVLPLLQQFLEHRGRSSLPPEAPEDDTAGPETLEWEWPRPEPQREPGRTMEPRAEEIAERDVVSEEQALELAALQEELSPEEAPEAVRVSAPVISLETLEPERAEERQVVRAEEHARFHELISSRAAARPAPPRIASLLGAPADLRRAVLLSEVLGPPRGMTDHG